MSKRKSFVLPLLVILLLVVGVAAAYYSSSGYFKGFIFHQPKVLENVPEVKKVDEVTMLDVCEGIQEDYVAESDIYATILMNYEQDLNDYEDAMDAYEMAMVEREQEMQDYEKDMEDYEEALIQHEQDMVAYEEEMEEYEQAVEDHEQAVEEYENYLQALAEKEEELLAKYPDLGEYSMQNSKNAYDRAVALEKFIEENEVLDPGPAPEEPSMPVFVLVEPNPPATSPVEPVEPDYPDDSALKKIEDDYESKDCFGLLGETVGGDGEVIYDLNEKEDLELGTVIKGPSPEEGIGADKLN